MPNYDVIIRGGTVVDGTGAEPFVADLGVKGSRITAVEGRLDGSVTREIDADGRVVTPGFFDPHTHIDAQIFWDPTGQPLTQHGVTSAVMGNCGITFAPCHPGHASQLADLMEAVEEVPAPIILSALPWDWEGYDGYLRSLDGIPKAINVGGMVGHSAVRAYAMGIEDSLDPERQPTPAELQVMEKLVDEALAGGALGFSTTRTLRHTLPDGRPVPGSFARTDELLRLCAPLQARGLGLVEVSARLWDKEDYGHWQDQFEQEMRLIVTLSRSTGRTVTFSVFNHQNRAQIYAAILDRTAEEVASGAQLRPQVAARRVGELISLAQNLPFDGEPWRRLSELAVADRLAALENAELCAQLVTAAPNGDSTPTAGGLYYLGQDTANYEYGPDDSLRAQAAAAGEKPVETFIRLCRETKGRAVWSREFLNQLLDGIERSITDPHTLLGLGDAGAHVGGICDASLPTYVLKHWVRDRQSLSLAEGVQRLTSDPARLFGQGDRGVLRPGAYADINVIDLDSLDLMVPEYANVLPGGAGMWTQKARGYELTLVNGRVSMEAGEFTGETAGQTMRNA